MGTTVASGADRLFTMRAVWRHGGRGEPRVGEGPLGAAEGAEGSPDGRIRGPRRSSILAMLRHPPLRLYALAWLPLLTVYVALYMGAGSPPAAAIRTTFLTILPFA